MPRDEMMDCAYAREEFAALLDGELNPEERLALEAHLAQCSDCLRELDGYKRVDTLYRALPVRVAPPEFEAKVRERLRPRVRILGRGASQRAFWPALALAASLLVVAGFLAVRHLEPGTMGMASTKEMAADTAMPPSAPLAASSENARRLMAAESAPKSASAPAEENALSGGMAGAAAGAGLTQMPALSGAGGVEQRTAAEERASSRDTVNAPRGLSGTVTDRLGLEPAPSAPAPGAAGSVVTSTPPPALEAATAEPEKMDASPSLLQVQEKTKREAIQPGRESGLDRLEAPASAPPSAPPPPVVQQNFFERAPVRKQVGDATFTLRDGVWVQSDYGGQETVKLARQSAETTRVLAAHEELAGVLELGERVVFKAGDTWYELQAASSP